LAAATDEAKEPAEETQPSAATGAELRKKPITTAKGELGELLANWWKERVARRKGTIHCF
jgi:hypothetical protein